LDPNADSIAEEKRRSLMDMDEGGGFYFDTDGMWEEKFGPHTDSKPYGPMSVGADITFPASTHLFGLPEHASSTQLKGTTGVGSHYKEPYRLYNLDVFEYELDETMALYGEVPLIVSQSKTSGTVGVFWFNPTETFVDVERRRTGLVNRVSSTCSSCLDPTPNLSMSNTPLLLDVCHCLQCGVLVIINAVGIIVTKRMYTMSMESLKNWIILMTCYGWI